MLKFALGHEGVVALRWPKAPYRLASLAGNDAPIEFGKSVTLREGTDVALVAYGAMVEPCLKAATLLEERGVSATVINARFAKPIDAEAMEQAAQSHAVVVTVEDHVLQAGFGSAVIEALADRGALDTRLVRIGIPDRFVEHGGRTELLDRIGLSPTRIAERCHQEHLAAHL